MLLKIARVIDGVNRRVGRSVAWLVIAMVAAQFAVVVLRYVFSIGFVWLQELVLYFYGMLFLLGAGYTLLCDGHVRVDVFYRTATARTRTVVDLAGSLLLLLPLCGLILWSSWGYVLDAWSVAEASGEAQGLPLTFVYKTLIWAFAVLLGGQGISLCLKSLARLAAADDRAGASDP